MLDAFSFPLQILDQNESDVKENIDNNALYYQPQEHYTAKMATANSGDIAEIVDWYWTFGTYAQKCKEDIKMLNVKNFDDDSCIVDGEYDDYNVKIDYHVIIGSSWTYLNANGRGFALAFDQADDGHVYWGPALSSDERPIKDNYYRTFVPASWSEIDPKEFSYQFYAQYNQNATHDYQVIESLDDWCGASVWYQLLPCSAASAAFPELSVIVETGENKKSSFITVIANDKDVYLPVVYGGHIKLSNHKNWRQLLRPHRNINVTDFAIYKGLFTSGVGTEFNPVPVGSVAYNACLWAVATPGWGVTAEGKVSGSDWYDNSLIRSSRIKYNVSDNETRKELLIKMNDGIPLWHVTSNGKAILNITMSDFDESRATPKLYISDEPIKGMNASLFTNLLNISTDAHNYTDTSVQLKPGDNTIYVNNLMKNQILYFKIIHQTNEEIMIKTKPTMTLIEE